jgi:hypothetical protein
VSEFNIDKEFPELADAGCNFCHMPLSLCECADMASMPVDALEEPVVQGACADCLRYSKCREIFHGLSGRDTACGFSPSLFTPDTREYFDPLDYCPGGIDAG